MKKQELRANESTGLRKKAEELLKQKLSKTDRQLSETDTLKLLHELDVHQIELKLQNDELFVTNEKLEVTAGKYRELYDFAPMGYFTLSRKGQIHEVNICGAKMLGKDRKHLYNNMFSFFITSDARPVFTSFLDKVFISTQKELCEVTLITDDGHPLYVHISGICSESYGEQCFLITNDVTDQRINLDKLMAEQAFRNSIESALTSGIAIVNQEGRQIYVNSSFCALFGWSEEELIGRTAPFVYWPPEHLVAISQAFMDTVANRAPKEGFDLVFMHKDTTLIPVKVIISPFSDGKQPIGWLANVIDNTQQKMAEEKIAQLMESLEDRIAERTQKLTAINKKLTFHLKEIEQFIYISSHDLSEPLNTLTNFTNLIHQEYAGKLDEDGNKSIDFIYQSANNMKFKLKGLVDYSLLGKDSFRGNVDCNKVVSEVLSDLSESIDRSNAKFILLDLPTIHGYSPEIRLLFQNLIDNAIKFQMPELTPVIEVSAEKKEKEWIFSLKDNGIGIKERDRESIFFIFKRMVRREEFDGIGIGLAYCKKIVEMHGGRIWVESNESGGSTFRFTIPFLMPN
jgi:PAS domain S-box-containing protein